MKNTKQCKILNIVGWTFFGITVTCLTVTGVIIWQAILAVDVPPVSSGYIAEGIEGFIFLIIVAGIAVIMNFVCLILGSVYISRTKIAPLWFWYSLGPLVIVISSFVYIGLV